MSQTAPATATTNSRLILWVMLFGNFLIGTGALLPSGLLNDIATDFKISPANAGMLVLLGGLVVGFGAPLLATATSKMDRRLLLTASLMIYALGHLASALLPDFQAQEIARTFTIIGAAIFTPQAAATAGLIVPAEKRAATIAFIFIGWSAANVAGIPLSGLLSSEFGWRGVYLLMAALSLLGAIAVWLTVPKKLFVQPIGLASWGKAFGSAQVITVFAVTLCSFAGFFALFGYFAPILRDAFHASPKLISLVFLVFGVAGVVGNSIASRIVGRFGVDRVIAGGLASMVMGFLGFYVFFGNYTLALASSVLFGLGSFSSNSLQQSRLAQLAPAIASVTIALNTSFVYFGQAIGAKAGGLLLDAGLMQRVPLMSLAFMISALLLSLLATRMAKKA